MKTRGELVDALLREGEQASRSDAGRARPRAGHAEPPVCMWPGRESSSSAHLPRQSRSRRASSLFGSCAERLKDLRRRARQCTLERTNLSCSLRSASKSAAPPGPPSQRGSPRATRFVSEAVTSTGRRLRSTRACAIGFDAELVWPTDRVRLRICNIAASGLAATLQARLVPRQYY